MTALVLLAAALLALLFVRRRVLTRERGSFDCSVRVVTGRRWSLGVARFGSREVEWWKVFSLSWRPHCHWERSSFGILDRRWPDGSRDAQVHGSAVLLRCDSAGDVIDVAMTAEAYTGFASWLEAAPPGPASAVT